MSHHLPYYLQTEKPDVQQFNYGHGFGQFNEDGGDSDYPAQEGEYNSNYTDNYWGEEDKHTSYSGNRDSGSFDNNSYHGAVQDVHTDPIVAGLGWLSVGYY